MRVCEIPIPQYPRRIKEEAGTRTRAECGAPLRHFGIEVSTPVFNPCLRASVPPCKRPADRPAMGIQRAWTSPGTWTRIGQRIGAKFWTTVSETWYLGFTSFGGPPVHFKIVRKNRPNRYHGVLYLYKPQG